MAQTKMFRDRVVSMEQTLELGEKYLPTLTELLAEALPGFEAGEHELIHELDLFVLHLKDPATEAVKRVSFTRMVLSDPACIPALAETPQIPARDRLLQCIGRQATQGDIDVTFRAVMDDEERTEAEQIDAEWRKKNEVILAAKRAEEEKRAAERRRQKQIEDQRRQQKQKGREAQKPRDGARPGGGSGPVPATGERRSRNNRLRGGGAGGGANAGAAARQRGAAGASQPGAEGNAHQETNQSRPVQIQGNRPPRNPQPPRPPQQPRAAQTPRPPRPIPAPQSAEGGNVAALEPKGEGGENRPPDAARRRRRRGRGGRSGGQRSSGGGPGPAPAGGGTTP
ncbi:MAG: hypothetical protein ABIT01_16850 [Thermoanaerobaculia bacterium]